MASLPTGGIAEQLPVKLEVTTRTTNVLDKLPRRQWTLIAVTAVLNVLFFSSFMCIIAQIYEIVDDPGDTTNIASEVLTLTSVSGKVSCILRVANTNTSTGLGYPGLYQSPLYFLVQAENMATPKTTSLRK